MLQAVLLGIPISALISAKLASLRLIYCTILHTSIFQLLLSPLRGGEDYCALAIIDLLKCC